MNIQSTTYRGYRLVDDPDQGYVEIWSGGEPITQEDDVWKAKKTIDGWLDAR